MNVYAKTIGGDFYSLKKEGGRYYWVDVSSTNGAAPSFYLLAGVSYEQIFGYKKHLPYRWYHKHKYLSYAIEAFTLIPFMPLLVILLICYIRNIENFKKVRDDMQALFKMFKKNVR